MAVASAAMIFLCGTRSPATFSRQAAEPVGKSAAEVNAVYAEGMAALQRRDLGAARVSFEKVVRLAPSSAEAHNSLGWVLLSLGQLDAAIVHLRAAVKLNPGFAQARMNLSNALQQKGELAGAEREARE